MNPKTKFWINTTGREIALEAFSLPMALQALILLKIYKWTNLGPTLFQQKFLGGKNTNYQVLQFLWSYEIWPLVKWIPVAIVLNVLVKKLMRQSKS